MVEALPLPAGAIPRVGYGSGTFWGHYKTGVHRGQLNDGLVAAVRKERQLATQK